ncbi:MAG: tetratricopeptide repeat protein [Gemmatimonadota bacterium]
MTRSQHPEEDGSGADPGFWTRMRQGRFGQILVVYLGFSWVILQVVGELRESLNLPASIGPITLLLLGVGLAVTLATAWVQSHLEQRQATGELPGSWDLSLGELKESILRGRVPHLTWARALLGGVFAFSLLFGFAGLYVLIQDRGRSLAPEELASGDAEPGIAILPFDVNDAALDDLREGVPLLLATTLHSAAGVRPIAANTVLAHWDRGVAAGERADLALALEIARASGGSYALTGSAVALGGDIRLAGELFETTSGEPLGRVRVEGARDSVWTLVDGLAVEVVKTLTTVGGDGADVFNLAGVTTRSPAALAAYLEGEAHYRRGDFERAVTSLEAAVEEDSTFALAHYRLGQALSWFGLGDRSSAHLEKARTGSLPDRQVLFSRMTTATTRGRSTEPLDDLGAFVRQHPEDAEAWNALGEVLFHEGVLLDSPDWLDEATTALERAVELEPGSGLYLFHPLHQAFARGDSAHAAYLIERFGAVHAGSPMDLGHRLIWRYEFGSALPAMPPDSAVATLVSLGQWGGMLAFASRSFELGEAYLLRQSDGLGELPFELCNSVPLRAGRWKSLISYAADERMPFQSRFLCLHGAVQSGLPVPEAMLEEVTRSALAQNREETLRLGAYQLGAYYVDRGRWPQYEDLRAELRERLEAARSRADSVRADEWEFQLGSLQAYAHWAEGRREEAAKTLESLRPTQWQEHKWWLGRIYAELGRPADAARWLTGIIGGDGPYWPHVAPLLGSAYEQLGATDRAADLYRDFIARWKDADPELQPWVREAQDLLERIEGEGRPAA